MTSPSPPPPSDPADDDAVWSLFDALCELDPAAREAALHARDDAPRVRDRVRRLLAAHDRRDALLDRGLPELAPGLDAGEALVGREFAGYRVLGVLGTGGSSTVFEARQREPDRRVALKVLRLGSFHAPSLARFQQECRVLARLQHPGIAQIHEVGTVDGPAGPTPFFAMELVPGAGLLEHAERAALDARACLELLARVCDAVQYAHGKGVIHRDLKPANILVDAGGQPKVVDFGVARVLDDELAGATMTQAGQVVGTLPFMSPEQLAGDRQEVDARSDVFALGVIAFRLLSGALPFERGRAALGATGEHPAPRRLGALVPALRGDVETLVGKAIAPDPDARYATVAEFAADIRRHLADLPITARPPSAAYVLRKFVRRHRGLSAGFGVACAALVIATLVSLHHAGRARAEAARMALVADLAQVDALPGADAGVWPLRGASVPALEAWLARFDALHAKLPRYRRALDELRADALPISADELRADRDAWEARGAALARDHALQAEKTAVGLARHGRDDEPLMGVCSYAREERHKLARNVHAAERHAAQGGRRTRFRYADEVDAWTDASLTRLIERIEALDAPGEPSRHALNRGCVERMLAYARALPELTLERAADAWRDARADIAASAHYAGLQLEPVEGLLPLGADPDTGLWEFAHLPSGFPARRDPLSGRLELHESMGIVLVLLPGGPCCVGARGGADAGAAAHDTRDASPAADIAAAIERARDGCAHVDPAATRDEGPVLRLELAPFLISKFETTQRQWLNFAAGSPATYDAYNFFDPDTLLTGRHPVESVTWEECADVARRMGLEIPSEIQWEYAARAGSTRPWWCESQPLAAGENLADASYLAWTGHPASHGEPWRDGHAVHAPVGSAAPNAFGLHDMLGNLREWTRDRFVYYDAHPRKPRCGTAIVAGHGDRVVRGGSYRTLAFQARASRRTGRETRVHRADDLGVRFVLELPER